MKIVSNPDQVCLEHALEFWTGLLVYARNRSDPGPSPRVDERYPIRLAS
jgi:hypothetical protein